MIRYFILYNLKDTDPHRLIQLNDFVKVYPSRNSNTRYEFTIEEKNGLEIVMASDNCADRSAWITSLNMFIKMERLILNLIDATDDIRPTTLDTSKATAQSADKADMDLIKNELEYIKQQLKTQEPSLLSKISNQLEKQNALLEKLCSPTSAMETNPKIPDRSVGYLLSNMNDKLTRLLSSIDYLTDRVSTSLKRDQDILKTQNQLMKQLDQNHEELISLNRACYHSLQNLVPRDVNTKIVMQAADSSETIIGTQEIN